MTTTEPKSTYLRVRGKAKQAINRIAAQHRLTLVDTADVLIEAFESLTHKQQRAVIEQRGTTISEPTKSKRGRPPKQSSQPKPIRYSVDQIRQEVKNLLRIHTSGDWHSDSYVQAMRAWEPSSEQIDFLQRCANRTAIVFTLEVMLGIGGGPSHNLPSRAVSDETIQEIKTSGKSVIEVQDCWLKPYIDFARPFEIHRIGAANSAHDIECGAVHSAGWDFARDCESALKSCGIAARCYWKCQHVEVEAIFVSPRAKDSFSNPCEFYKRIPKNSEPPASPNGDAA